MQTKAQLQSSYGNDCVIPNIPPQTLFCLEQQSSLYYLGDQQTDKLLDTLQLPHIWTHPYETKVISAPITQGKFVPPLPPGPPPSRYSLATLSVPTIAPSPPSLPLPMPTAVEDVVSIEIMPQQQYEDDRQMTCDVDDDVLLPQ